MPAVSDLFAQDVIVLFGRPYDGLALPSPSPVDAADNTETDPLQKRLLQPGNMKPPQLALIYGYSYRGSYVKLTDSAVMLVWGKGVLVPPERWNIPLTPFGIARTGKLFADGMVCWESSRLEHSLQITVKRGEIEHLLVGQQKQAEPSTQPNAAHQVEVAVMDRLAAVVSALPSALQSRSASIAQISLLLAGLFFAIIFSVLLLGSYWQGSAEKTDGWHGCCAACSPCTINQVPANQVPSPDNAPVNVTIQPPGQSYRKHSTAPQN